MPFLHLCHNFKICISDLMQQSLKSMPAAFHNQQARNGVRTNSVSSLHTVLFLNFDLYLASINVDSTFYTKQSEQSQNQFCFNTFISF
ncbi:hypothetical protein [Lapidilactobacillus wuchangensis]|uniref:hypothetical protein n=1 Tax=Lapidilactobacillus wuchangensis TaxID=2486001 RepID=UPI0013DE6479|nr:hypothetical protein [Lapidilactobacillus wuchangensis]